jgi:hypothetical protein
VEITSAVAVKRAAAVGEQKAKLGHAARGDWALGVQPQRREHALIPMWPKCTTASSRRSAAAY